MRILIADDDSLILQVLWDALEADGHIVTATNGGRQAIDAFRLAWARDVTFDLVITDLGMPRVSGHRVVAAVKQISPSTPVILLTGWGYAPVAGEEGFGKEDLILPKPPRLADLRAAVARLTK